MIKSKNLLTKPIFKQPFNNQSIIMKKTNSLGDLGNF